MQLLAKDLHDLSNQSTESITAPLSSVPATRAKIGTHLYSPRSSCSDEAAWSSVTVEPAAEATDRTRGCRGLRQRTSTFSRLLEAGLVTRSWSASLRYQFGTGRETRFESSRIYREGTPGATAYLSRGGNHGATSAPEVGRDPPTSYRQRRPEHWRWSTQHTPPPSCACLQGVRQKFLPAALLFSLPSRFAPASGAGTQIICMTPAVYM